MVQNRNLSQKYLATWVSPPNGKWGGLGSLPPPNYLKRISHNSGTSASSPLPVPPGGHPTDGLRRSLRTARNHLTHDWVSPQHPLPRQQQALLFFTSSGESECTEDRLDPRWGFAHAGLTRRPLPCCSFEEFRRLHRVRKPIHHLVSRLICWHSGSSAAVMRCSLLLGVAMHPTTFGCGAVSVVVLFISASHSPMLLSLTSPGKSIRLTVLMWASASMRDSPQSTALQRTATPAALCFPATQCKSTSSPLCTVFLISGHWTRHCGVRSRTELGAMQICNAPGSTTPPRAWTS